MSERPEIVSGFQKEGIKTRRGISIWTPLFLIKYLVLQFSCGRLGGRGIVRCFCHCSNALGGVYVMMKQLDKPLYNTFIL